MKHLVLYEGYNNQHYKKLLDDFVDEVFKLYEKKIDDLELEKNEKDPNFIGYDIIHEHYTEVTVEHFTDESTFAVLVHFESWEASNFLKYILSKYTEIHQLSSISFGTDNIPIEKIPEIIERITTDYDIFKSTIKYNL